MQWLTRSKEARAKANKETSATKNKRQSVWS